MMRIVPAAVDLLLILVFAVIGRASHQQALDPLGVLTTAWPFLVAGLVAWVVLNLLDDDGFGLRSALVVWLVTLTAGMGLRIVAGGGAALAFVLVAAGVLFAFLFGWRIVLGLVRRRKQSHSSEAVPLS